MSDIQNFKEETFTLIKQQTTRIKTLTKQMEIKDQQIKFLKETITTVESEKENFEGKCNQYKNKLQAMVREVSTYNENVVQKLAEENEFLKNKIEEMEKSLSVACETGKSITHEYQASEEKIADLREALSETETSFKALSASHRCLTQSHENLQKKHNEIEQRNIRLEALVEQQEHKNRTNEKQIETLVQKCQQTTNSYEKKMRKLMNQVVSKEHIQKFEQQIQNHIKKINQLSIQNSRIGREKEQFRLQEKILKEKLISEEARKDIQSGLIQIDLKNVVQSLNFGKKVMEYESKYSEYFYDIYEHFFKLASCNKEMIQNLQTLKDQNSECNRKIFDLKNIVDEKDQEIIMLKDKLRNELQLLQCSYESKILQLSLKIQRQEKALEQLCIHNKQYQKLKLQYSTLQQEQTHQQESSEHTIIQYKKQNEKLMEEVQQLLSLCDENINTKNSLNVLKHLLHDFLSVIHFLYKEVMDRQKMIRNIYYPFMQARYKRQVREDKLKKFRVCAWMVIACIRMKKNSESKHKGIIWHANKAISSRSKVESVTQYLDLIMNRAIEQKDPLDLILYTKSIYKWPYQELKNRKIKVQEDF